jgi:hypothetical protein
MTLVRPGVPNPSGTAGGLRSGPLTQPEVVDRIGRDRAGRPLKPRGCGGLMGSRARIRWENVAKLGAGGIACLALVAGLPALLRRPEPPPLEADIGFAPAGRPAQPADGLRASGGDRRRRSARSHRGQDRARRHSHARPNRRPPHTPERARAHPSAPPAPAAAPAPSAAPAPPPPAPVAPPKPPAPAPAPAPPDPDPPPPSSPSEFGFER